MYISDFKILFKSKLYFCVLRAGFFERNASYSSEICEIACTFLRQVILARENDKI